MGNFWTTIWNEVTEPAGSGGGDPNMNGFVVDKKEIRRLGLTYIGKDSRGNRMWQDAQGNIYYARDLQKSSQDEPEEEEKKKPVSQQASDDWKKYTRPYNPVTDTKPALDSDYSEDIPMTAGPGKFSKQAIRQQMLAHQRVQNAMNMQMEVVLKRNNVINGKNVTETTILNRGRRGYGTYIVRFDGMLKPDGSLIADQPVTLSYPALPGDAGTVVDTHTDGPGSSTAPGGTSGGSGGGGGSSSGPSGGNPFSSSGGGGGTEGVNPTDTEPVLSTEVTQQQHHTPGRDEHGPNSGDGDFDEYFYVPEPQKVQPSIETLYEEYKKKVRDKITNIPLRADDAVEIVDWLARETQLDRIAKNISIKGSIETKYLWGLFTVGDIPEMSTLTVSFGDLNEYAKTKEKFEFFLIILGHEYLHSWQRAHGMWGDSKHTERELMAYIFTLQPNEFIKWTNSIEFKLNFKSFPKISYKFPNITNNPAYRQFYSFKAYEYYTRLPENRKYLYKKFVDNYLKYYVERILLIRPTKEQPDPETNIVRLDKIPKLPKSKKKIKPKSQRMKVITSPEYKFYSTPDSTIIPPEFLKQLKKNLIGNLIKRKNTKQHTPKKKDHKRKGYGQITYYKSWKKSIKKAH